ncbi:MAG: MBL fold metallo-hydrolase [Pseudomonadota bacterium]
MKVLLITLLIFFPTWLAAQDRRPSHCIALAQKADVPFVHKASFHTPPSTFSVRISYIDHAMFLIQSAGGTSAVTDYTGFLGLRDFVPDVVTMNHAHDSHWTSYPDPKIPNVLKGWEHGGRAEHHLDLGDMLVRNVPTDIRARFGGGVEKDGNSIFVFETEGLCIGHLGHLHHEPSPQQYAALGRLDVVMAAVDGGMTVDLPTMIRILKRLKSSVVVPMHWWSRTNLNMFLAGMADEFAIDRTGGTSFEVSLRTLPDRPTVRVLQPRYLQGDADE